MENRRHERTGCNSPVHFISSHIPYRGSILNVSKKGILVMSDSRLKPGSEVKICYSDDMKIAINKGTVVWSSADKLGIRF